MLDLICIIIDGEPAEVPPGVSLAVALLIKGSSTFRPLCGMGVCFGCRVSIDGALHQRSCQILCSDGMEVSTS